MRRQQQTYYTSNVNWYQPPVNYRNEVDEYQNAFPSTYDSFQIQESPVARPPEQPVFSYYPSYYSQLGAGNTFYGATESYGSQNPSAQQSSPFTPYPSHPSSLLSQQIQPQQGHPFLLGQQTGVTPHTPYPVNQKKKQQQQTSGVGSFMNQFKTNDGSSYDVNKMMNTAGQMISTVNQFTGMFKSFGSFLK